MNVRIFQGANHHFALASDGSGTGYTFSSDLLSCQWAVPALADLRSDGALLLDRHRAKQMIRAILRKHDYLDLRYGEPLRTLFRADKQPGNPLNPANVIAVFVDMPYNGAADDTRTLGYNPLKHDFFPAYEHVVMTRFRPARPSEYAALRADLETRFFPELRPLIFARPVKQAAV